MGKYPFHLELYEITLEGFSYMPKLGEQIKDNIKMFERSVHILREAVL